MSDYPIRQRSANGQPSPIGVFDRVCRKCGASFIGLAPGKTGERGLWSEWGLVVFPGMCAGHFGALIDSHTVNLYSVAMSIKWYSGLRVNPYPAIALLPTGELTDGFEIIGTDLSVMWRHWSMEQRAAWRHGDTHRRMFA